MDGLLSKRAELPDDLACFLQQQKQRQARMETTMRSFPNSMESEMEKQEMVSKRKRNTHEVRAVWPFPVLCTPLLEIIVSFDFSWKLIFNYMVIKQLLFINDI